MKKKNLINYLKDVNNSPLLDIVARKRFIITLENVLLDHNDARSRSSEFVYSKLNKFYFFETSALDRFGPLSPVPVFQYVKTVSEKEHLFELGCFCGKDYQFATKGHY